MRHGEAVGHGPCLGEIAACDRGDDTVLGVLNGGYDEFTADLGCRQNSETQHLAVSFSYATRGRGIPLGPELCRHYPRGTYLASRS